MLRSPPTSTGEAFTPPALLRALSRTLCEDCRIASAPLRPDVVRGASFLCCTLSSSIKTWINASTVMCPYPTAANSCSSDGKLNAERM